MKRKMEVSCSAPETSLKVDEQYSEKCFVVYGKGTKAHSQTLKSLGGKFNRNLRIGNGWVFSNSSTRKEEVMDFVLRVNAGEVSEVSVPFVPSQDMDGEVNLPTVPVPKDDSSYQWVKFKVFRPKENAAVTLKTGSSSKKGCVVRTETHNNVLDTVYVEFDGNTSKAMICNGKWQIFGYFPEHTLFFS